VAMRTPYAAVAMQPHSQKRAISLRKKEGK